MVALIPPVQIELPSPTQPLRYGLFSAANGPFDLPVHARQGGLQYEHAMCGPGFGYEVECAPNLNTKPAGEPTEVVTATPFVVATKIRCGSVGHTEADWRRLGVQQLKSIEQSQVEQIFSAGTFNADPSLANNADVVDVVTAAVSIVDVIGVLEDSMYSTGYGVPAVLHLPFQLGERAKSEHLLDWDGTRWRTVVGTIVSIGDYANLSPAGAAPAAGTFWAYITGQTSIWRTADSDVFVAPIEGTFNRTTNQVDVLVEREYVVAFECGGFAEDVTLWV
jgi:hypothetical protein